MNRQRKLMAILAAVLALGVAGSALAAREYEDLVGRLTDLERLATLPQPGEKCMQFSSFDRRSSYNANTGEYVLWAANDDRGGFIREEGGGIVIAEMDGPGCIWRIWSATVGDGHVKIYLDGSAQPAVDLPFRAYFDRTTDPFIYESLCYDSAEGKNCYVPIPFAKKCKIVAEPNWGAYYHITYSLLAPGTQVKSFALPLAPKAQAALVAADDFFRTKMGTDPAAAARQQVTLASTQIVHSGQAATVAELQGPRAITALRVKGLYSDRADQMAALRQLVLRITWDGAEKPAVWCPLGDFFGTAPGVNLYKSLPLGMTQEGFYSYWYMPFASSARIEIVNEGAADRELTFEVTHAPLTQAVEAYGRFHAKWHRDAMPVSTDRWPDWTVVKTEGRGRFCGMMLHVWNPKGSWWGEGDEKFFVDGEKFPSTFGTGTEDYFGYAWCNPTLFARAFHSQTISMNNAGHVSVNRWHVGDNIPFHESFEGAIEKYFPNERPTLYAAVAYWYLSADGRDPHGETPVAERHDYYAGGPGPIITAQPANATVNAGQTATFSVTVNGAGSRPLAYQWYSNNAVIAGSPASSYTTPATTTADSGRQYKVTVASTYGTVTSSVATLTVIAAPTTVVATGGTVMSAGAYTYHIFTSSGTFTNYSLSAVDVFVVAGGGGAGGGKDFGAGGGGAGGVILDNAYSVTAGSSYTVTVGSGGAGGYPDHNVNGTNGGNSCFGALQASGGGGGAMGNGGNGLSGGGGGGGAGTGSGGLGTNGQGKNGGNGLSTSPYTGGGGGGYVQNGYNGNAASTNGGRGGDGINMTTWLNGLALGDNGYFAGGGAAGSDFGPARAGGIGGGGSELSGDRNGRANTGGGGGAYDKVGPAGSGGSGIVIVRYVTGQGIRLTPPRAGK